MFCTIAHHAFFNHTSKHPFFFLVLATVRCKAPFMGAPLVSIGYHVIEECWHVFKAARSENVHGTWQRDSEIHCSVLLLCCGVSRPETLTAAFLLHTPNRIDNLLTFNILNFSFYFLFVFRGPVMSELSILKWG